MSHANMLESGFVYIEVIRFSSLIGCLLVDLLTLSKGIDLNKFG